MQDALEALDSSLSMLITNIDSDLMSSESESASSERNHIRQQFSQADATPQSFNDFFQFLRGAGTNGIIEQYAQKGVSFSATLSEDSSVL